jgi:hypothetical protein
MFDLGMILEGVGNGSITIQTSRPWFDEFDWIRKASLRAFSCFSSDPLPLAYRLINCRGSAIGGKEKTSAA